MHYAGSLVEDLCRVCKESRRHTVIAAAANGEILRVICDYCGSQHNYRGDPQRSVNTPQRAPVATQPVGARVSIVSERERTGGPMTIQTTDATSIDLELLLRRIIREESGVTPVAPAEKWRGGEFVLRPGKPGIQEKSFPIETFFHKVVMLRNRLRVLEQQINSAELPEEAKLKLQGYITGCYGTLTSFNILFANDEDRFKGSGGD